jgi:AcrR family transcriptional regulator
MSLIAKESGASVGTIYHYFADKDELIHALYRNIKTKFNRALGAGDIGELPLQLAFRQVWLNAYYFYHSHQTEAYFLAHYENSPYQQQDMLADQVTQRSMSDLAEEYLPVLARLVYDPSHQLVTKPLPLDALYELTIGVAARVAMHRLAGLPDLDEDTLQAIADACYQAVMP